MPHLTEAHLLLADYHPSGRTGIALRAAVSPKSTCRKQKYLRTCGSNGSYGQFFSSGQEGHQKRNKVDLVDSI
jgi:hypothetical protein